MNARSFGQRQFAPPRPSRAARAIVFALVSTLILVTGAVAPVPTAARPHLAQCSSPSYWGCLLMHPDSLPGGAMGDMYSQQLQATDSGCLCRGFDVVFYMEADNPWNSPGTMPPGLTLASSGLLSGVLAAPGTYSFRLAAMENNWCDQGWGCFTVTVTGTNHQPTFTAGGDVTVLQDDPPYSAIWATNISKGPPEDAGQTLTFRVSNNNNALFSVQPAIAADGTLSFTLAPDGNGVATVSAYLEDNGGVAGGGINHSPTVTFQINVTPYDQPQNGPIFTVSSTDWTTDHACTKHSCTLREAIEAANNYGGNNAAGPASTIELAPGAVYPIDGVDNTSADDSPNGLPQITSNITINGHGASIRRSDTAPSTRLIDVGGGFLTLNEIALENGKAGPSIHSLAAGGAILDRGQLVIKNSYLANNAAEYGGAIFNPGGLAAWIYNSTFYANSAQDAGAIYSFDSLDLYNNTFFDNIGVNRSAIVLGSTWDTKYNFYNNLFVSSNSSVPLCNLGGPSDILTVGGNLATDSSCTGFGITTYSAVKAMAPPDYNGGLTKNIAIQFGSSAIDMGNAAACLNANIAGRDQRGEPRFVDGNGDGVAQCDVGAYEYVAVMLPPPVEPETDPPQVSVLLSPAAPVGSNDWYRSPVTVQPQASDASPVIDLRCALDPASSPAAFDDLPEDVCPFLGGAQVTIDGEHTLYAAGMDIWGNKSEAVSSSFNIDATPPVLTCPEAGPFLLHSGEHTVGPAGVDASVSGLDEAASTLSGIVTTESVGPKTPTFTAVDLAGNSASRDCTYDVIFDFGGYYPPVEPAPALNKAKAGSAIPLKFSLAGDQGLEVIAAGYPASQAADCDTLEPISSLKPTEPPGRSGLGYAAGNGWYSYGWKTSKEWAGTCRALVAQLVDGTEHQAYFQFK